MAVRNRRIALLAALAVPAAAHPTVAQAQPRATGVDTTNFDRNVRPQDDFFRYVNGTWLKKTEIPADAATWGAFNELGERSRDALRTLLSEVSADKPSATVVSGAPTNARASSVERRKVGDLYASFLDSAGIEKRGITTLQPELRRIAQITSAAQLPAALAQLARVGVGGPLTIGVGADQKNSRQNVLSVGQGGLGLPDRDYYLSSDPKLAAAKQAYEAYIARLLTLAGESDANGAAARIVALETQIAEKHWDRARQRDRNATYNRMTVSQLAAMMPSYDIKAYLAAAGLGAATDVVVRQPDFITSLDAIVKGTPAGTWREYLTFRTIDNYATMLPSAYQNARFEFRGRTLNGQQQMPAMWKRAVDATDGILGESAGKMYVENYFRADSKARMDAMVRNLRKAYEVGIDSLEWMTPETKTEAKLKLAKFTVKIAYPDKWRDFTALAVKRDDAAGNVMRARAFEYADMTSRLGKPVDRDRWGMNPQTVNAYYNATNNEIVFPAAILQPPFFDPSADDAVNYGGIGAVIGHEIGHGFDDQGRKSDGDGNLRDWWTPADAAAFEARTTKLGAQYEAIYPLEGVHINGKLTMGENIGDLSGLAQAYRAYHISLGGKEPPVIDGLTGDQRFFLGFAQIWRTKFRDEALRQRLLSDPHSPGMQRAFVPLVNNDAFMKAFNVKPGDKMWRDPADRVRIW